MTKPNRLVVYLVTFGLLLTLSAASLSAAPSAAGPNNRQIPSGGTTSINPDVTGADGLQQPEPFAFNADFFYFNFLKACI